MELTDEVVYILVQRLNSENKGEVDKDIIMQVFSDKEQAEYSRDRREKEARENGFDDIYVVNENTKIENIKVELNNQTYEFKENNQIVINGLDEKTTYTLKVNS